MCWPVEDKNFLFQGLWHAVVLYFGCYLLWQSDPAFFGTGITLDYWSFGTLIYHAVIFVVSIKVLNFTILNGAILSNLFLSVDYRISLLDSLIRFFDPDIDFGIYRSYFPVLWNRYVSTVNGTILLK